MKEIIGNRLMKLRGDAPREKVAESINVSVSALQMYENGQRVPRDEIKLRIASYYEKTVQEIFFDFEPHESCSDEESAGKVVG